MAKDWTWRPVTDRRGRRLRGLWRRAGKYFVQKRVAGKPVRIPVPGRTPEQARDAALALRPEATPNRRPSVATVSVLVEDFLAEGQVTFAPATRAGQKAALKAFASSFGSLPAGKLTPRTVLQYVAGRQAAGVSNRSISTELCHLRALLRFAATSGVPTLAAREVRHLKFAPKAKRLLSSPEVAALAEAGRRLPPPWSTIIPDLVRVLAASGGRFRETCLLTWDCVDLPGEVLHFPAETSKTRKARVVEFNPALAEVLSEMNLRRTGPHLFAPEGRPLFHQVYMHAFFRRAVALAQIPGATPHLLRHYFISKAVMAGVDYLTICRWSGHADSRLIHSTYGHLAAAHPRAMARRLLL